jgi:hypothetical protein
MSCVGCGWARAHVGVWVRACACACVNVGVQRAVDTFQLLSADDTISHQQ